MQKGWYIAYGWPATKRNTGMIGWESGTRATAMAPVPGSVESRWGDNC